MNVDAVVHREGRNDVPLEVHRDNEPVEAARKLMFDIHIEQVDPLPALPHAGTSARTYARTHTHARRHSHTPQYSPPSMTSPRGNLNAQLSLNTPIAVVWLVAGLHPHSLFSHPITSGGPVTQPTGMRQGSAAEAVQIPGSCAAGGSRCTEGLPAHQQRTVPGGRRFRHVPRRSSASAHTSCNSSCWCLASCCRDIQYAGCCGKHQAQAMAECPRLQI